MIPRIMVSKDYLRFLVEVAKEKMEASTKRSEGFLRAFLKGSWCQKSLSKCTLEPINLVYPDVCYCRCIFSCLRFFITLSKDSKWFPSFCRA